MYVDERRHSGDARWLAVWSGIDNENGLVAQETEVFGQLYEP